jgi:hypothetical protein
LKVSDDFSTTSPSPSGAASSAASHDEPDSTRGERDGDPVKSTARPGVLDLLLRFVDDTVGSADGLIAIYADRARLSVRRKLVQTGIAAAVAVCAVLWLGAAALAVFRGVCGGLTVFWDGREWLGELSGGVLALAVGAGAIAIHLRLSSRREFLRLKAKYEAVRNARDKRTEPATTAGNGGGVA